METRYNEGFADGVDWARDIVDSVVGKYPEDIFPDDGATPDAKAGRMARHVCNLILQRLDEEGPSDPSEGE